MTKTHAKYNRIMLSNSFINYMKLLIIFFRSQFFKIVYFYWNNKLCFNIDHNIQVNALSLKKI